VENETDLFLRLSVALAIGLLMGLERGWETRELGEGSRLAGVRTFALAGMLGALWALLGRELGPVLLGIAFAGFAMIVAVAHVLARQKGTDVGATTLVAILFTFALGAVAMEGLLTIAAASAVVAATLLGSKPILHRLIRGLSRDELYAIFRLLLISVVALPVLPNRGYGPWQALNPYAIWWMVVLIAGISLAGYFAVRIVGPRLGLGATALTGGLVSSTAVTLSYSRLGRHTPQLGHVLAAGILMASGTMFFRVLLVATVIQRDLLGVLYLPLAAMGGVCFLAAAWLWRYGSQTGVRVGDVGEPPLKNPFELGMALQFGALLAAIMLLAKAVEVWWGDAGLYALAAASGLADVDPITLSLARMVGEGTLNLRIAALAIFIATAANTLVKGLLATSIAGGTIGRWVLGTFAVAISTGAVISLATSWTRV